MRFNAFTIMIISFTALALAGLGGWVHFAFAVAQDPSDSLSETLALVSILTSIVCTGLVSLWWHGYLAIEEGILLRVFSIMSIFLTTVLIMTVFGTVGYVYGFGVWMTAIISVYWGLATFPDVSARG